MPSNNAASSVGECAGVIKASVATDSLGDLLSSIENTLLEVKAMLSQSGDPAPLRPAFLDYKRSVELGAIINATLERVTAARKAVFHPVRRRLPTERQSMTHKFSIAGHEGYVTVGMFEDGCPGEVFMTMAKEGSTLSGLLDALAVTVSLTLQNGVPLQFLVDKFAHVRFEPSGWTGNKQIPYAKSIVDYIFRWLGIKFIGPEYGATEQETAPVEASGRDSQQELALDTAIADAPICTECGSIMSRNGSCYKCGNCGGTSGCS